MSDWNKIEAKLDKMGDRMSSIDTTLAKQAVILEEHVKRTNLLETKIEPIEKHVYLIKSLVKIVSFMGLGALMKFLHSLLSAKGML